MGVDSAAKPTECGNAHPSLGRARGPRPTWRRGVRFVCRAVDVGLEFLVLLFQDKRTINDKAAARQKKKIRLSSCGFTEKL